MKISGAVLLSGLLLLQGCAGLILREHDSAEMIAGKVLTRVVVGAATAGMSEVGIATIKQREELDASQQQAQLSPHEVGASWSVRDTWSHDRCRLAKSPGESGLLDHAADPGQPLFLVVGRGAA